MMIRRWFLGLLGLAPLALLAKPAGPREFRCRTCNSLVASAVPGYVVRPLPGCESYALCAEHHDGDQGLVTGWGFFYG